MIGPMSKVSASMLNASRALFKAPIVEGLPGAFADLIFDPSERYEGLWARASNTTGHPYSSDAAGEASAMMEPAGRSLVSSPRRLATSIRRSSQNARVDATPVGTWPPSAWESADPSPTHINAEEPKSVEAPERSRSLTPISSKLQRGSTATLSTHSLWERDAPTSPAAQPDQKRSPSFPPINPMPGRAQLETHGAGPQPSTPEPKGGSISAGNAKSITSRPERRETSEPTNVRLAKSFSDIGRILGSNLKHDADLPFPVALEGSQSSQSIASPVNRLPSHREPQPVASSRPEENRDIAPFQQLTPDMEAIFEELEQRLQLEYLRTYGTSEGF